MPRVIMQFACTLFERQQRRRNDMQEARTLFRWYSFSVTFLCYIQLSNCTQQSFFTLLIFGSTSSYQNEKDCFQFCTSMHKRWLPLPIPLKPFITWTFPFKVCTRASKERYWAANGKLLGRWHKFDPSARDTLEVSFLGRRTNLFSRAFHIFRNNLRSLARDS